MLVSHLTDNKYKCGKQSKKYFTKYEKQNDNGIRVHAADAVFLNRRCYESL